MTWLIVTEHRCHRWLWLCSLYRSHHPDLLTAVNAYYLIDTTGANDGAQTAYPYFYGRLLINSWYLPVFFTMKMIYDFTPGFQRDSCYSSFSFVVLVSLFVLFSVDFSFSNCVIAYFDCLFWYLQTSMYYDRNIF